MDINNIMQMMGKGFIVTSHGHDRLMERGISIDDVKTTILNGKIIEERPKDIPRPAYLISDNSIHVVVSVGKDKLHLVTAYYPSTDYFEADNKTRKRR